MFLIVAAWFGGIWWMIERSRFRIDHSSDVKALKWFYGLYVPASRAREIFKLPHFSDSEPQFEEFVRSTLLLLAGQIGAKGLSFFLVYHKKRLADLFERFGGHGDSCLGESSRKFGPGQSL